MEEFGVKNELEFVWVGGVVRFLFDPLLFVCP